MGRGVGALGMVVGATLAMQDQVRGSDSTRCQYLFSVCERTGLMLGQPFATCTKRAVIWAMEPADPG